MTRNHFTPIEQAMLDVLSDGKVHLREELHGCLSDELSPISGIYPHLSSIRMKLKAIGQGIGYARNDRGAFYYMTRILASPYKE